VQADEILPIINAFKLYYIWKQELAYITHDNIVDCGKSIQT